MQAGSSSGSPPNSKEKALDTGYRTYEEWQKLTSEERKAIHQAREQAEGKIPEEKHAAPQLHHHQGENLPRPQQTNQPMNDGVGSGRT